MTVGETVRTERKRLGLTQEALARRADMSLSAVTLIEHGKRTDLHHSTLKKLGAALGLTIAQITGEEPIPTGEPALSLGKAEAPEAGQRDIYTSWLEFVNMYADRWEAKIAEGALDMGAVREFISTQGDLWAILDRLGLQEKQEQPPDYIYSYGPTIDEAVARMDSLLEPLMEASHKQLEESDFARLWRLREERASERDQAASG